MNAPVWVLDDTPFGHLSQIFDPARAWPADLITVVRSVADAANVDKTKRRLRLLNASGPGRGSGRSRARRQCDNLVVPRAHRR